MYYPSVYNGEGFTTPLIRDLLRTTCRRVVPTTFRLFITFQAAWALDTELNTADGALVEFVKQDSTTPHTPRPSLQVSLALEATPHGRSADVGIKVFLNKKITAIF